ncbi:MAG TPA: RsmE family RNA methyltransferase [Tepidiformaceae bacterium]|nr:RsmE family RNA methyltransferase [Tepidiformaceae bacterium]
MKHIPRVFVPGRILQGLLTIEGEPARHLATVLRARPGDPVHLFSGDGKEWRAEVRTAGKSSVACEVGEVSRIEAPVVLHVWAAPVRANRFDWLIEKCAEAGADVIRPVITEFTQRADAAGNRVERWSRIAVEACEQCGRLFVPVIEPPTALEAALASYRGTLLFGDPDGLAAAEALRLVTPAGHVALVIGPAGGLSPSDVDRLRARGAIAMKFGPHLLRTETAALAGTAIIRSVLP